MLRKYPLTLALAWLSGVEPSLLAHAYTDRARYASLGLSVLGAAVVASTAAAVAAGMLVGRWGLWMLPVALLTSLHYFRRALTWVGTGERSGRRAGLVAAGLLLLAVVLEWPLGQALFHTADVQAFINSGTLITLHWALRAMLALVLLVPLYGLVAARRGSYALAVGKRKEINKLLLELQ